MHAVDVGFGGDSETTQVFRIGEASCAVRVRRRARGGTRGRTEASLGELLQPAIELARGGVRVDAAAGDLHAILDLILRPRPRQTPLQQDDGGRLLPGDVLRLPDLAGTLEHIALEGPDAIYRGELAAAIARTVRRGRRDVDDGGSR